MLNKKFKLNFIALTVAYALTPYTEAALVRNDVDYQIFRDFAENKGKFSVGATNVEVRKKDNQPLGTALPKDIPMIDFSAVDVNKRIGTLVDPQYIVSVKHAHQYMNDFYFGHYNGHRDVSDDENKYSVVTQNNDKPEEKWDYQKRLDDYNMPRLNKFVTEVAPTTPTLAGGGLETYKDKEKYPYFVRVGAGTQFVYEKDTYYTTNSTIIDKKTESGHDIKFLAEAYRYAIGGTPYKEINIDKVETKEGLIGFGDSHQHPNAKDVLSQDPLTNYGVLGDSGSPLFAFDKQQNKWIFIGPYTYWAGYGKKSWQEWNIYKKDFADTIHSRDNAETVPFSTSEYHWTTTGNSSQIKNTQKTISVKLLEPNTTLVNYRKEENKNTGQNVTFDDNTNNGKGTLILDDHINQGAGGLFFKGNYEVKGTTDNITWVGGGISVEEGKTVTWKVRNPEGDHLAKIGKGKLIVEGKGDNKGSLKVGDGTVVLKQQTTKGQHAFASVGIVSGRSTVVLNDDNQVDPNSIYFGFRGGRLDANGNNLTFEHIRNIDDGARLVNHNMTNASNITITGESLITNPNTITPYNIEAPDYENNPYYSFRRIKDGGQLYLNLENYTYYALRKGAKATSDLPYNSNVSNETWLYMGKNPDEAKKKTMEYINNSRMNGFNGYFGEEATKADQNGKLNVTFKGKTEQNRFLLTGGTNLNGDLNVEKGTLFLSGRPTPHARDIANISSTEKDKLFSENNEVVVEDDWINRNFKATNINVTNNATLYSGRNVESITSNITASNKAQVHIGYKAGDTVCVRSDYTGYVTCHNGTLSTKALNSFNATNVSGNVNLSDNANFVLGKANLHGSIQAGGNSQVRLTENSHWHLTGDSNVHQLDLKNGHIHLNSADNSNNVTKYNTLTVNSLSGNGSFYYWVDFTKNQGDKVVVTQSATGNFTLQVANKTGEPNHNELTLFDASNATERNGLNVSLANGKVDRGAWSYTLKENNGRYYLHNPKVEKRNLTVDTPSITTPNIQADAPSVPSNHEEIARVDEPVPLPAPPAPATTSTAPQNQNGFNRTGTGYSIVADTPETVRITHKNPNGEIIDEGFALKSDFHNSVDTNKKSFDGLVADKITPDGTNAYIITYKKVKDLVTPKRPIELKTDQPLTDEEKDPKKVAVVKPEDTPNGVPSREHSETAPKSDTATKADTSNSESVSSDTTETAEKNEQEVAETTAQNGEVAKEAQPTVEASTQTNEVAQNGSEKEEIQDVQKVTSKKPDTTVKANAPKKEVPINTKIEEAQAQPQTQPTTVTAAEETSPNSKPVEETQPSEETNAEPVTPVVVSEHQPEKTVSKPTGTEETATVETEKAQEASQVTSQASPKQEQSEDAKPQAEPESENVSTDKNSEEVQAQPETSATAVTEQPAKETSTKAEQSVTESTTVSTGTPVVENPEKTPATTQPAVNSEAVQSETATTETVSQPKVTSAEETTVTSTQEVSTPKPRSRRTRRSVQTNSYEPIELSTANTENTQSRNNVVNSQSALRDLTSTNTNAVISDARAKAQFVALNVGKAVSQHISQLEMNNEGQYNVWVSNTSMNKNYSSEQYRRFSSKSTQTQLGWDQTISNNVQLGGVFTYVRNSNNFDKASSKNTLAQVNFYSKYYADNHWYLGIDLGYGKFQSNLQTNNNAKFARHTAQIGLTAGKAFNLGNFAVKPTVGVRYSYLSNANFALAQDRIKVNPISVKTAFAQVDLSYTYHLGEFSITPILSARYDANQGNGKINVSVYDFAYNVENQQQYNAGLKLKYHNVKLSLIGGLTKAKQAEKQKTAEVKLSFSF
ncbi:IgA-specific serine endopeptidase autotransporter IgaA2 [Haemophilus influenzae]|uniref:Immunoglobulin A1 protease autotransporter n=1 Tax=Haemophilus influenzae TaxID=727 RepID=A0AAJ8WQL1_HAEIF|nr:IgA-specific serine endopeptidase autotransporter IgaA2 [Haemophilus influenzae]AJO91087.1 Immunoglobulin A1 protease autotransporter precursor [Haemophilus influenzae]KMZ31524.1 peptidase [Haemophilus influenzae]MCK8868155.1 IgA-specific serine endopeptidase autotransporter IgaA2 [Haemophilus influenzae]MCK8875069.1 IgA-specific serine endopeptidase autotransporter IgaA2 [Haemophilus influenzae]MCK8915134.1 IgA-specific serine endopeptidase autotransporter IgaA2 [Haemophilus influenzae]